MTIFEYLERTMGTARDGGKARTAAHHGGLSARYSAKQLIWAGLDFLAAMVAGYLAFLIRRTGMPIPHDPLDQLWMNLPLISIAYVGLFGFYLLLCARMYGLYQEFDIRSALNEQRLTLQTVVTAGLLLCGTLFVTRAYAVSRIVVAVTLVLTMLAMMTRRAVTRRLHQRRFLDGRETRNVLIVGEGRVAHALRNHLQSLPQMGFRFKGFVAVEGGEGSEFVTDLGNCVTVARTLFVDEIYFTTPVPKETVIAIVDEAHVHGIDVRVVPDLYDGLAWNAPVEYVGQFPTIPLHHRNFPRWALAFKRVMDFVLCAVALLLLLPVMLVIAVLVKVDSPGPVFYRAARVGRKGRIFTCYKFRTMVDRADDLKTSLAHRNERDSVLFKISDDPRITRVGVRLRKYSLDELPQLLNVLAGDMSIVGPRPPLASEVERYDLSHLRRLDVLPGITGLWQVEARQDPSFDNYISLDTAYVENWNLALDLRIIAKTVGVVLAGTGT